MQHKCNMYSCFSNIRLFWNLFWNGEWISPKSLITLYVNKQMGVMHLDRNYTIKKSTFSLQCVAILATLDIMTRMDLQMWTSLANSDMANIFWSRKKLGPRSGSKNVQTLRNIRYHVSENVDKVRSGFFHQTLWKCMKSLWLNASSIKSLIGDT